MTDYIAPRQQQEMELAAFEKGRMQGEMEAARRIEAEQLQHQKQMPNEVLPLQQGTNLQRPDVVEINRLTWLQRAAFVLGEGCIIASLALVIVWLEVYDRDVSWRQSDAPGDFDFYNTGFLTAILGLFFEAQAITNYRAFPLHLSPMINRAWYVFLMSAAVVCYSLSLVSQVRSSPEASFWSVWHWVYAMAFACFALHALYSIISTLLEPLHHRHVGHTGQGNYSTWSETGTHLETPEQKRDHSAYNHLARTVYTAAPRTLHRGRNLPASNANVGAEVPVAPANAPRWTENPNTHAEHYWLLPRAKWATVAYWSMGVAVLMMIAQQQALLASGRTHWAQGGATQDPIHENGNHAGLLGALGLVVLGSLIFMSYVAMPPRTALVKNGILVDPNNRRASISQTAETRLGHNMV